MEVAKMSLWRAARRLVKLCLFASEGRRRRARRGIFAAALGCALAWASAAGAANWHDHLFILPRPADFALALDAREERDPPLAQALDDFPNPQRALERYLRDFARIDGALLEREGLSQIDHWTLFAFLRRLVKLGIPLDRALAFNGRRRGEAENRESYLFLFNLRKGLYLNSSPETVERVFASYLRWELPENRDVIVASASPSAFSLEQRPKLARLRASARALGGDLRFFLAIQRPSWALDQIRWPSGDLGQLVALDILHGLDLNGSLEEIVAAPWESQRSPRELADRILALFAVATKLAIPLRIHAFEHRNSGVFYDALAIALREYAAVDQTIAEDTGAARGERALDLQIGHMVQLTGEWIELFSALGPRIRVSLQSTPASYEYLVLDHSGEKLRQIEALARERGIPVRSGFDGRGVFSHTWPALAGAKGPPSSDPRPAPACAGFFGARPLAPGLAFSR